MTPIDYTAGAVALFAVLATVIIAAWWRWIEAPSRRYDTTEARHARHTDWETADLDAELSDIDTWREDWTSEELERLHDDTTGTPEPLGTWDFAAWEIEQSNHRIAARNAAQRVQDALTSRALADPWWIRRH